MHDQQVACFTACFVSLPFQRPNQSQKCLKVKSFVGPAGVASDRDSLVFNGIGNRGMTAPTSRIWRSLLAANASKLGLPQGFLATGEISTVRPPDLLSSAAAAYKSTKAAQQSSDPTSHTAAFSAAGRVTGPFSVTRQPAFAIVELGPTQYKVTPDDLVYTEKLKGVDVNDKISLNRVLLLGTQSQTVIGRPYVPAASVLACVEVQCCIACSCIHTQFVKGKI